MIEITCDRLGRTIAGQPPEDTAAHLRTLIDLALPVS